METMEKYRRTNKKIRVNFFLKKKLVFTYIERITQ